MKKTIVVTSSILLAGILSYFGGYYYYTSTNSKSKLIDSLPVQRTVRFLEDNSSMMEEHYFLKIEQEILVIYKMPEEIIYDSVKLSTLHLTDTEYTALRNGIDFYSLAEVFEFLENSMS